MPASEAHVLANRAISARSTGPKTIEAERSRRTVLEHGLTGEDVALPVEDAAEIERMYTAFEADLRPSDEMGRFLIRRAATYAVRMERSVLQEAATLRARMLEAQAEAEANGEDPVEAGRRALFDPSKEACLARKYEAAAERGFFRALKEFRQLQREAKAPTGAKSEAEAIRKQVDQLASFFPAVNQPSGPDKPAVPKPSATPRPATPPPSKTRKTVLPAWNPVFNGLVDVPITIGLSR